jgi:radical SAM-linked protein
VSEQIKSRYRLTFSKTEAMRYTGHLDLHRTWERTFRRAKLPLAYSQGFNPRPRINLASALPLGFTSQGEVLDVWLDEGIPADELCARLEPALPPGLQILTIDQVDPRAPALQSELSASEFVITFLEQLPQLTERCQAIMAASELPRQRRGKPYNLRQLILDLQILEPDANGCQRIFTRLTAQGGATGRPEELVLELGGQPETTRVHRLNLIFGSD